METDERTDVDDERPAGGRRMDHLVPLRAGEGALLDAQLLDAVFSGLLVKLERVLVEGVVLVLVAARAEEALEREAPAHGRRGRRHGDVPSVRGRTRGRDDEEERVL